MRRLLSSFVCVAALWVSSSAMAADGSSGCGPGWYVFKENSMLSSAARAVTNWVLFPSSTLGMTFGTSNCTQHKLVLQEKASLHFATMAYHDLMIQAALGQGQHLAAFAHTLGCDWRVQETFNRSLQAHYDTLFPSTTDDPSTLVGGAIEQILANPELSRQCAAGLS